MEPVTEPTKCSVHCDMCPVGEQTPIPSLVFLGGTVHCAHRFDSVEQGISMSPEEIIEELRPTEKQTVMSLVQKAGVDVSEWYEAKTAPAANPKFCYNWTFL